MNYLDLSDTLKCDTYFVVKYGNSFCHYHIMQYRKDGTPVLYGELYNYFTNKEGFRFAKGYELEEDHTHYKATQQYFYFDKHQLPFEDHRKLKHYLLKEKTTLYRNSKRQ